MCIEVIDFDNLTLAFYPNKFILFYFSSAEVCHMLNKNALENYGTYESSRKSVISGTFKLNISIKILPRKRIYGYVKFNLIVHHMTITASVMISINHYIK